MDMNTWPALCQRPYFLLAISVVKLDLRIWPVVAHELEASYLALSDFLVEQNLALLGISHLRLLSEVVSCRQSLILEDESVGLAVILLVPLVASVALEALALPAFVLQLLF